MLRLAPVSQIVDPEIGLLEIQRVAPTWAEVDGRNQVRGHLRARSIGNIDLVYVGKMPPEHRIVLIRRAVDGESAQAMLGETNIFFEVVRKRHQLAAFDGATPPSRCGRGRDWRSASAR